MINASNHRHPSVQALYRSEPWFVAGLDRVALLTAQQTAVLRCLARGMSNTDIARELGRSEWTVKPHVSAVMARLEVESRLQAGIIGFAVYGFSGASADSMTPHTLVRLCTDFPAGDDESAGTEVRVVHLRGRNGMSDEPQNDPAEETPRTDNVEAYGIEVEDDTEIPGWNPNAGCA